MTNRVLIADVLDQIEWTQRKGGIVRDGTLYTWNQEVWSTGLTALSSGERERLAQEEREAPTCGTALCFAGWATLLTGHETSDHSTEYVYLRTDDPMDEIRARAEDDDEEEFDFDIMWVPRPMVNKRLRDHRGEPIVVARPWVPGYPFVTNSRGEVATLQISALAVLRLDLSEGEADELFASGNSLSEIREIVHELISDSAGNHQ